MAYERCRGKLRDGSPCRQTMFLTADGYCRHHLPALVKMEQDEVMAALAAVSPVATESVDVTLEDFTNGRARKQKETAMDGEVVVTYHYKGKRYGGCLQWWELRTTGNGVPIGKVERFTLFPTVLDRENNRKRVAEYSRKVEGQLQAKRMTDLSHPVPAMALAGWR